MRNYLLLLFSIIFFKIGLCQTNVYHPFPDSNAVWKCDKGGKNSGLCNSGCYGGVCLNQQDYQDSLGGDTIIQAKKYRKVYTKSIIRHYWSSTTCVPGTKPDTVYTNGYIGYLCAIRQDKNLKKIFMVPTSNITEDVLYDFSLKLGDTLSHFMKHVHPDNYVCKMDSVLIGTSYHKRFGICYFNLPGYDYVSIIEGIGSTFGLIEYLVMPFERYSYLRCINLNSKSIYPDPATVCNNLFTGIKDYNASYFFSVLPNPSTGKFTVKSEMVLKRCVVMDVLGNIVYSDDNIQSASFDISLLQLSNGIYFLKVTDVHNNEQVTKIIVEH